MTRATLTFRITDDAVLLDAVNADGYTTWQGRFSWDTYELGGMFARMTRDVPDWVIENAPAWVRQWDDAAAQA